MVAQVTRSYKIDTDQFKLLERLNGQFHLPKSEYEQGRWIGQGCVVVFYKSKKAVVQGAAQCVEEVSQFFEKVTNQSISDEKYVGSIGFDEAGKGEFFGPLVLAGCYPRPESYEKLLAAGVQDSKKIADNRIITLDPIVRGLSDYEVRRIVPDELCALWNETENLSKIMSSEFAKMIKKMTDRSDLEEVTVVVDKFSSVTNRLTGDFRRISNNKNVQIVQEERGEKYLSVACASILARANYLRWIEETERYFLSKFNLDEFKLLRGYNGLTEYGKEFVKRYGREEFNRISKRFFKSYSQVVSSLF